MKICKTCGVKFKSKVIVDYKIRNLKNRSECLVCQPFKTRFWKYMDDDMQFKKNFRTMTEEEKEKYNKYRYKINKNKNLYKKIKLVSIFGGKCSKCGYDNNLSNLCFHHKSNSNKKFEINTYNFNRKWKNVLEEAGKCELLCSNCHMDIHYPDGLNWKNIKL